MTDCSCTKPRTLRSFRLGQWRTILAGSPWMWDRSKVLIEGDRSNWRSEEMIEGSRRCHENGRVPRKWRVTLWRRVNRLKMYGNFLFIATQCFWADGTNGDLSKSPWKADDSWRLRCRMQELSVGYPFRDGRWHGSCSRICTRSRNLAHSREGFPSTYPCDSILPCVIETRRKRYRLAVMRSDQQDSEHAPKNLRSPSWTSSSKMTSSNSWGRSINFVLAECGVEDFV